jgi:hypothetical protein
MPGERFCQAHLEIVSRVKAPFRRPAKYDKAIPGAAVKVTHVAPEPKPKPPRKAPEPKPIRPPTETARTRAAAAILAALQAGPLDSGALAAACGTTPKAHPFVLARRALLAAGKIVDLGPGGRKTRGRRQHVYGLSPAPL